MNKKQSLLYLDIDGVLLGKNNPNDTEIILAKHAKEFLEFCLENFKCYWLTTHCKDGDASPLIQQLREYADDSVIELIRRFCPAIWKTLKTEAIDFASDFYWIDDDPLQCEIDQLKQNKVFDRWIEVNTRKRPDGLSLAIKTLRER
jgi:hypothetical protein